MNEKNYAEEYGNRCRQVRQAKGISQTELAEKMGTTPQNISRLERDGISNVNDVMRISEILGQDITCDQIDQEGVVGEIGQEILIQLVKEKGRMEYSTLRTHMFGMNDQRIATELFKLERIGNIVREQYKNFKNKNCDTIFITAKGVITIKNMARPVIDVISFILNDEFMTYERLVGDKKNLQEVIDQDEISKLLWNLPYANGYRIDYIQYLKKNYRNDKPQKPMIEDYERTILDSMCLTGYDCCVDVLYRMALGLENYIFEEDEDDDTTAFYEEMYENDYATKCLFDNIFPWGKASVIIDDIDKDKISKEHEGDYLDLQEEAYEEGYYNHPVDQNYWKDCFFRHVEKIKAYDYRNWFTKDEINDFIEKNYHSANTEEERRVDEAIARINELEPKTLEYYEYRENDYFEKIGMAQKIRDIYGVPKHN